ncbi:MAG: recombination protein F [Elusimicrobia bacterium ADurb.Bin231]|nr:MAG: recombination protein F [Elusimicrobia bacterium ADurb.Bin231]
MIQIEAIEILNFRSIYEVKLENLQDLNVLSGKNDCGKSNILKALNLFFNNETDWHTPFDFSKDFSHKRLEQVKKSTHERQFVRVTLTFIRGERLRKSLPNNFKVTKTWYRDSSIPDVKSTIEQHFKSGHIGTKNLFVAQRGLNRFLNSLKYEYVPAVKDKSFFAYSLGLLQDSVIKKQRISLGGVDTKILLNNLNKSVKDETNLIKEEFKNVCGVETDIQLPEDRAELFRAFRVATNIGKNRVPLEMRGDGIQTRFLPSLLHYVANNSKYYYIWGFEEPENCLEYLMANALAKDFQNNYSKSVQCFLTSHSHAFIYLSATNVKVYRVYFAEDSTKVVSLNANNSQKEEKDLHDELGFDELFKKHQNEIDQKQKEINSIYKLLNKQTRPVLLTEGKSDVTILETAWKKLYPSTNRPFEIISCDPCPAGGAGGVGMLAKALESCRVTLPPTVGLFDRDNDGIKQYNELDKNFHTINQQNQISYKIHKNNHVIAVLLPENISNRKTFIEKENLPIEYLFSEQYVRQQKNGKGLVFKQLPRIVKIGNKNESSKPTTEPEYRKIVENKIFFAKNVVCDFPTEAFENFKILFNNLRVLFNVIENTKHQILVDSVTPQEGANITSLGSLQNTTIKKRTPTIEGYETVVSTVEGNLELSQDEKRNIIELVKKIHSINSTIKIQLPKYACRCSITFSIGNQRFAAIWVDKESVWIYHPAVKNLNLPKDILLEDDPNYKEHEVWKKHFKLTNLEDAMSLINSIYKNKERKEVLIK